MPESMTITLTRNIKTSCFDVLLDIGRAQKRSDVQAILMRANELGGRISAEDICNSLFINRPPSFGKTIIQRCRDYGLLDFAGGLTAEGRDALEKERIFVPEEGRFRMICALDSALPSRVLELTPVPEPFIQDSIDGRKRDSREQRNSMPKRSDTPTPRWVKDLEGQDLHVLKDWDEVRIFRVGDWCLPQPTAQQNTPALTWTLPADARPTLKVSWEKKDQDLEPPQVPFITVLRSILDPRIQDDWAAEAGSLRRHFDNLSDGERRSFLTTIRVERPQLQEFGEFDATVIERIPISPKRGDDAQRWAEWLVRDRVRDFLETPAYQALVEEVQGCFPGFHIKLPTREELARNIREEAMQGGGRLPKAYWYLQTPIDLGFEGGRV